MKCSGCGDYLTEATASKSWKYRCKPCVNAWFADYRERKRNAARHPG